MDGGGILGPDDVAGIERIIASSIAPAFLLTGIFSALNVLAGRLGRLIDRERAIREGRSEALEGEQARLAQRARAVHRAIFACVVAAILLCALIVWSFVGGALGLPVAWVLAALLVAAMLALIVALVLLLAEVRIASRHLPLDDDRGAP
jgi:MFS family permease